MPGMAWQVYACAAALANALAIIAMFAVVLSTRRWPTEYYRLRFLVVRVFFLRRVCPPGCCLQCPARQLSAEQGKAVTSETRSSWSLKVIAC